MQSRCKFFFGSQKDKGSLKKQRLRGTSKDSSNSPRKKALLAFLKAVERLRRQSSSASGSLPKTQNSPILTGRQQKPFLKTKFSTVCQYFKLKAHFETVYWVKLDHGWHMFLRNSPLMVGFLPLIRVQLSAELNAPFKGHFQPSRSLWDDGVLSNTLPRTHVIKSAGQIFTAQRFLTHFGII